MGKSGQNSQLFTKAMQAIAKYYPKGCVPSEGLELSREWKQQLFLRDEGLPLHQEAIRKLLDEMRTHFPPSAIDENSCISLYPCYNLRILMKPSCRWPDQRVWNWDVKMIRRWKTAFWVDLFFSYLGPFSSMVTSEFAAKGQEVLVRRKPADWLCKQDGRFRALVSALGREWRAIPFSVLKKVIPGFATETGGLGKNTVYHLLFSDTFPAPQRWNSKWESIDPSPEEPLVVPEDEQDKPLGYLIPEAVLRNELGR